MDKARRSGFMEVSQQWWELGNERDRKRDLTRKDKAEVAGVFASRSANPETRTRMAEP